MARRLRKQYLEAQACGLAFLRVFRVSVVQQLLLFFQPGPARPAKIEGRRILFAALRAGDGRAAGRRLQVFIDESAGAVRVGGIFDPHLGQRRVDRQLAGEARGVRVEDSNANASIREQVCEEVRLRQVRRGMDPFQNRIETIPVTPSSETFERPETL
jgi:hypothetical protein